MKCLILVLCVLAVLLAVSSAGMSPQNSVWFLLETPRRGAL
jgi:hypothetical protein